ARTAAVAAAVSFAMSETGEPGAGAPSTVQSSLRAGAACGGRSARRAGASLPGMMREDTLKPASCSPSLVAHCLLTSSLPRRAVDRAAPGRAVLEPTRTPRMDVDAVVAEVAAAVGLAEGPAGVADVLRVIARHEPVAAREVGRRAELPVPIVVAVCN